MLPYGMDNNRKIYKLPTTYSCSTMKQFIEQLKHLGLNTYESKAYKTLLEMGTSTAYTVAKISGVPQGKIYPVLDDLQRKGALTIHAGTPKHYTPTSPDIYLEALLKLQEEKTVATPQVQRRGFWNLFAVITSSAFLDGLNPCAFAVLLFFISFLFTIKRTRATIWKMGLVYIGSIYLAYLLIGLGIAQTIIISGSPHLMAKIGAYGGAVFGGFLVGLCTFPCSGGIYVAIIGMVTTQRTALQGTGWMLWYNLIFVSPLLILLALAANPKSTQHLQKLERTQARHMKILLGAFMIALGAVILIFFT
ncbi:MAG: hypothetical protein UY76_C0028G0021 [Candidatus Uhrbacteria bacterium GW2011_GWA2_52_8d]|uniref:Transcription regulator TrmB N-terminal domain-containing protein n=1 Tax=Candidatus Uhrbacteria bacterium GW2011_GWA2_52_8d TaxID=1618979 RepID=A0A0G1XNJ9_9BACT|nr:MAG: hypothetical protein UY76_C0028G0021 [Candidatus Uhrbacteria bacterium GW2011_GWA2_52_8d]